MLCSFSTFLTILIQQDIFRLNGFFISSHLFTLSLPRYFVILSIQEHFLRDLLPQSTGQPEGSKQCADRTLVKTDF